MTYAVANIALHPNFKTFTRKIDPYTNVTTMLRGGLRSSASASLIFPAVELV